MITPAYCRTMAAYNAEMNRRLYDAANRLSDAERRRDCSAFWHSIHGTLVHILWGDAQWMSRFDNWERPTTPIKQSDHFIEDWAELRTARDKADAAKTAILNGSLSIYRGALKDNKGNTVIPAGTSYVITEPKLESMNYLVEGVIGSA